MLDRAISFSLVSGGVLYIQHSRTTRLDRLGCTSVKTCSNMSKISFLLRPLIADMGTRKEAER